MVSVIAGLGVLGIIGTLGYLFAVAQREGREQRGVEAALEDTNPEFDIPVVVGNDGDDDGA
jgi:hypothetical protein